MTVQPPYTVTITITDRWKGLGPSIIASIEPAPNPAHISEAVKLWLMLRNYIQTLNSIPKKGKPSEKASKTNQVPHHSRSTKRAR